MGVEVRRGITVDLSDRFLVVAPFVEHLPGDIFEVSRGLPKSALEKIRQKGLMPLVGRTAWSKGYWNFSSDERRAWNSLQNVPRDIMQLAHHLVGVTKRGTGVNAIGPT